MIKTTPSWIVVSAPSGAGKTTLCKRLMQEYPAIEYSVSCTTRKPRPTERDGVSYYFISSADFHTRVAQQSFLEYAEVHGCMYGTLKDTVSTALAAGRDIMMDIDVQGAQQIRDYLSGPDVDPLLKQSYVDVFIVPPGLKELEQRLMTRGEDAPDVIARRLANAQREMDRWAEYQYVIVNDQLDESYSALRSVYIASGLRTLK